MVIDYKKKYLKYKAKYMKAKMHGGSPWWKMAMPYGLKWIERRNKKIAQDDEQSGEGSGINNLQDKIDEYIAKGEMAKLLWVINKYIYSDANKSTKFNNLETVMKKLTYDEHTAPIIWFTIHCLTDDERCGDEAIKIDGAEAIKIDIRNIINILLIPIQNHIEENPEAAILRNPPIPTTWTILQAGHKRLEKEVEVEAVSWWDKLLNKKSPNDTPGWPAQNYIQKLANIWDLALMNMAESIKQHVGQQEELDKEDEEQEHSTNLNKETLLTEEMTALSGEEQAELGKNYYLGKDELMNKKLAVKLYQLSAAKGNADGLANLGYMYESGSGGLKKNFDMALFLFQQSADAGNADGLANLGSMYESGKGVKKNLKKAVELYEKSVDAGNAQGQSNLALMYAKGLGGLEENMVKAVELYRLSADQGNAYGQVNLGMMYAKGLGGLERDETKAVELYEKSADQGNATGQVNLGVMYYNGLGDLPKNRAKAVELFRLSAAQGNKDARNHHKILIWQDQRAQAVVDADEEANRRAEEEPPPYAKVALAKGEVAQSEEKEAKRRADEEANRRADEEANRRAEEWKAKRLANAEESNRRAEESKRQAEQYRRDLERSRYMGGQGLDYR
tara:strand:- start:60 stop:1919 length:1860 start_codon:yes stop_codon:yes gene_type:complete